MAKINLHNDFKDLLKLLTSTGAEYLLVGGYAVAFHGHPRTTGDMDIWIPIDKANSAKVRQALVEFGIPESSIPTEILLQENKVIRMGVPPIRIELHTGISGVAFEDCYSRRVAAVVDDTPVNLISLEDLKNNKAASGRHKDLDDLENLK